MNKIVISILAVAVVAVGGYFLLNNASQPLPSVNQTNSLQPVLEQTDNEEIIQPQEEQTPTVNENVITYTNSGYSPNTITIKKGESVTFKNESSSSMWPASAVHPIHRVYSGTSLDEHCPDTANSTFDACTGILPGGSWVFQFDKTGNWKYHNHLSPKNFGTIIVVE